MKTRKTKQLYEFTNVLSKAQLQSINGMHEPQPKADPTDCEGGQIFSIPHGRCMDPDLVGGIDVNGCSDIGLP